MKIPFIKMHGLGNDFVVIDELDGEIQSQSKGSPPLLDTERAIRICDRRFGVGADQILWLRRPQDSSADARMEILNADGSIAEMCGNGIRAVALYVDGRKPEARKPAYRIETMAGMKTVRLEGGQVVVDMGAPGFEGRGEILSVLGREIPFFEVSMGNPHAVIFVENFLTFPVEEFGPAIERHPRFPRRTNVEFVRVVGKSAIEVKVWERGAGITLACGTGACASAVASLGTGRVSEEVRVALPGGVLSISWGGPGQPVLMKGPAVEVFRGEMEL